MQHTRYATTKFLLLVLAMTLGAATTQAELPDNAVWIDVRSPGEFASGHIERAHNIPFDGIEKGVAAIKLNADTPIYLYCAVGGRAEKARLSLVAAGFNNVVNVGGLKDARKLLN